MPAHYGSDRDMLMNQLNVVHSGWVLKKKRKKMQGESRRSPQSEWKQ